MAEKFAIAFDLHGDQQHRPTVRAFKRFCDDYKPKIRIAGGDIWDFRPLRKGASEEEKAESIVDDFKCGYEFLAWFQPQTFILGNHDQRLWDVAANGNGPVADLARQFAGRVKSLSRSIRCRMLPHDKGVAVRVGPLTVTHGFATGEGAAKKHAITYGKCIFGHIHADDHVVVPGHPVRREAWSAPCMCNMSMSYNVKTLSTLRYVNGWVYGVIDGRAFHVDVARVENGRVIYAPEFKVLAA